jgi:NAD(P)-dependent dehydrogenase (short-subunit alcohol dehydrogenase family)
MALPLTACLAPRLFEGHTVFVTGGGSGINLGIATAFATLGANVAICGRTAQRLEAAALELRRFGGRVFTSVADVRDPEALALAIEQAGAELGDIRTLVCGAAGNFVSPAEAISPKGFRTVVEIDLLGAFNAAHAAFGQLRRTRGSVLFISGGQSYVPFRYQAHVGAAKAGIDMLMRDLALEWGPLGIRCNSIVPGPVEGTEGMQRLSPQGDTSLWSRMTPLGRMARVDEVAQMAVVLASPLGSYVSGAVLPVDGGQNLTGSALFNEQVERMLMQRAQP